MGRQINGEKLKGVDGLKGEIYGGVNLRGCKFTRNILMGEYINGDGENELMGRWRYWGDMSLGVKRGGGRGEAVGKRA